MLRASYEAKNRLGKTRVLQRTLEGDGGGPRRTGDEGDLAFPDILDRDLDRRGTSFPVRGEKTASAQGRLFASGGKAKSLCSLASPA